ncbi:MAG: DEAD/DEAH box helicase [Nocardiaceae bacterium]|nr:DEAD/DEAH box helicase [Nocardiaceae bacterium]
MSLSRADLRPYQNRAVEFIKANNNAYLMLDPGLGKSATTLTAYLDLLSTFDVRRMLVIAPLRVARKVWKDELSTWAHLHGLTISCIVGTWAEKAAALRVPADIHTVNRESLAWIEAQFIQGKKQLKVWPWQVVCGDEFQSLRSQTSQRWKALNRLRRLFPRLVALSGTPAPGGYHNLWAQYALLTPPGAVNPLGSTEQAFLDRWFENPTEQNALARPRLRPGAKEQIQAAIAPITLSMRAKDYIDMPPVRTNKIRVELTPGQMAKYKKFRREYIYELASQRKITAVNAGVLHGKLLQLANGAIYVDDKGNFEEFHTAKLEALEEQLETLSVRGPVLIGYNFKSDLARMTPILERYCGKAKSFCQLKTDRSFDEWATGEIDFGLVHPGSAGHGLNSVYKSGAQDLLWFGLSPDYELYDQLNKRLTGGHRIVGRDVCLHHIIAEGTQDEDTYALLNGKAQDQDDLTDAMARLTRS